MVTKNFEDIESIEERENKGIFGGWSLGNKNQFLTTKLDVVFSSLALVSLICKWTSMKSIPRGERCTLKMN